MNKADLINAVAENTGAKKKDAEVAVNAITACIEEALTAGEKVQIIGFGTFDVAKRAARKGRNPQTGKEIKIAASKSPKFKAGKSLKDLVNSKKK